MGRAARLVTSPLYHTGRTGRFYLHHTPHSAAKTSLTQDSPPRCPNIARLHILRDTHQRSKSHGDWGPINDQIRMSATLRKNGVFSDQMFAKIRKGGLFWGIFGFDL